MARLIGDRKRTEERGSSWRWWLTGLAVVALLYWLIPEYGLAPSSAGETVLPPLEQPEQAPEDSVRAEATPEPSASAERVTLRGRCLDAESELGLPGFTVRLLAEDGRSLEATTSASGDFELSWPGAEPARIAVLRREGWSEGLGPRALTAAELAAEAELLLSVPTLHRSVVRGTVVMRRTEQGLPFVKLRLVAAGATELLTADASGGFSSAREYGEGPLAVELFDELDRSSETLGELELEHSPDADQPFELSVEVGPTLMLRTTSPDAAAALDWRARIVERRGDPELSGRLVRGPSSWVLSSPDSVVEQRDWSWQGAHLGPTPWIRYAEVEHEPADGFRPFLEVESANGDLLGESALDSTVGVFATPTEVSLRRVGTLSGELRDAENQPVADAKLWLSKAGGQPVLGPWKSEADGSYRVPDLEVGPYQLTVLAPLRPPLVQELVLAPGENRQPQLVLGSADSATTIRGRFECRLSHGPAVVLLELESQSGHDKRRKLLRRIQSANQSTRLVNPTNEFSFTSLPGGTYELRPIPISGSHHWIPDEITVTTPTGPLLFRCGGSAPSLNMQLEALDSNSSGRVPGQELYLGPAKQPPFTWPESRPAERWYTVPTHSPLTWTVWAPGYRPASGELEDLTGSGRKSPLQIVLERGYGMRLTFRVGVPGAADSRGDAPVLPGIEVRVDGARFGVSDRNGELLLQLDQPPERIELLHERWLAVRVEPNENSEERLPVLCVWFEPR